LLLPNWAFHANTFTFIHRFAAFPSCTEKTAFLWVAWALGTDAFFHAFFIVSNGQPFFLLLFAVYCFQLNIYALILFGLATLLIDECEQPIRFYN
jgi:hypothetical protein